MTEQQFGALIEEKLLEVAEKQEQIYTEISEELTFSDEEFLAFVETKILEGYVHFSKISNGLLDVFAKNFNDGAHQELYNILMDSLTRTVEALASMKEELELVA